MIFGTIDRLILFGGAPALAEIAQQVTKEKKLALFVFSCERQLQEKIFPDGTSLEDFLKQEEIWYRSSEDINQNSELRRLISPTTLGLGIGEAWSFNQELIQLFGGKLLDLMGVRLPQYRGGAHYTWQILSGNKLGSVSLQVVNEHMVQGKFDNGEIVDRKDYFLPAAARIPQDYFNAASKQEAKFVLEFLSKVHTGSDFILSPIQESFSIFFPRLNTKRNAWIDWGWDAQNLDRFICAFDDPYVGASTLWNGRRVHLKKSNIETADGIFHPYQAGLVYRATDDALFLATRSSTLVIRELRDEAGKNVLSEIPVGSRFFTPKNLVEDGMAFSADYSEKGLVSS